jgi:hypothetical protein
LPPTPRRTGKETPFLVKRWALLASATEFRLKVEGIGQVIISNQEPIRTGTIQAHHGKTYWNNIK